MKGGYAISEVIPTSGDKTIGGIKPNNEFDPPKHERKKKTDTTPVSQQEAELESQQHSEETGRNFGTVLGMFSGVE